MNSMKTKKKEKPFLQMDELERERAWDSIYESLDEEMLDEARAGKDQICTVSLVVLKRPDGSTGIVSWSAEYGDDDAIDSDRERVQRIRRNKMLKPGEEVEHFTTEIAISQNRWVPVR